VRARDAPNKTVRYLALLRGINVGGKNVVSMSELRACFERLGLQNVSTYIQSGNVIFESSSRSTAKLSRTIEQAVSAARAKRAYTVVVVLSHEQLADVVEKAPAGFGADLAQYRYDVIFLRAPVCARDVLPDIRINPAADQVLAANGVVYFQRLIAEASKSYLAKLAGHSQYRAMTLRNWNTALKLYELMGVRERL